MTSTHAQRKALGDYGERIAAQHLEAQGFVVLDRNWRCSVGELDIVAADGDTLVACEVKTRSDERFGSPLEAITPQKAARLYRLIRLWSHQRPCRYADLRIDVVAIIRPKHGSLRVEHVRGVV